jgi:hypothetical protein
MDDEFRYIRARVDKLRRARNYAEALELLEFVPKAYPSGKYTEEASGLVALMMGERRQGIQDQLIEEKEQRDVLAQDLDAFAVLLPRRERYADPTLAVDFDRLADTAETKEIKQACAILADVQEAEIRLLRRIPEHWRKTNSPALLEACGKGLDNKGQRVRDISAKELTIISDATVKRIQWKSLTPAQLYAIFRAAEGEFVKTVPTYSYELYLFCLGRALPSFADELMRLNDTQFEDSAAEAAELPKLLKAIMELEKK